MTTQTNVKNYPEPPVFLTVEEERRHRKERLAAAFRVFARLGYEEGVAGHISVRDPGDPDLFWVNSLGIHFSQIKVSNLLLVNHKGDILEGKGFINRAAIAIHSQLYQARPDVIAGAHAHSLYGKAFSSLGRLLGPLTQDASVFYEDHALFDDFTGVVLKDDEGVRIAKALGEKKAVILRNHGLLTVGHSVDEAAWWFITFDRSAHAQLLAEAAGNPILIDPPTARLTHQQIGGHYNGWLGFQPHWQKVLEEKPDFLE